MGGSCRANFCMSHVHTHGRPGSVHPRTRSRSLSVKRCVWRATVPKGHLPSSGADAGHWLDATVRPRMMESQLPCGGEKKGSRPDKALKLVLEPSWALQSESVIGTLVRGHHCGSM